LADEEGYSAIEIARERNQEDIVLLLQRFMRNPSQTRHEICGELGFTDALAADLFALTVLLCDDFLKVKSGRTRHTSNPRPLTGRFFSIIARLPMELHRMV
jgi:hypothetical protein